MYNVISFEATKHDNHCQRCPMYGMCLGLGNQNRTTFITHSGKMSLRWLTTFLNLGSDLSAVLFLSLYLSSRKTPRWKSIVQKDLYFSFRKELFFRSGNSGSVDHHICLFCSSVMHGLQKQCGHSSQFSFWGIQNVLTKSWSSQLVSWETLPSLNSISSKSHALKLMNWIIVSLCSGLTFKEIMLVSSFSSILQNEWFGGKFSGHGVHTKGEFLICLLSLMTIVIVKIPFYNIKIVKISSTIKSHIKAIIN